MLKKVIDYLVNDLGVNANAAVSIILTLCTFVLGYLINWAVSSFSKYKKRKRYKKSLKIIINDFLKSCEKQYLEFDKFSTQAGYLRGSDYTISIASSYSQNYLSNLDINIFIENFSSFKKNRASEISRLFEIIEKVRSVKELLKETVNFTYSKYSENIDIYNTNLDNLRKLQDNLAIQVKEKPADLESVVYFQSIFNIFMGWKDKGGTTDVNVTVSEIVDPLYNLSIYMPPNQTSQNVIEFCLRCKLAVDNIKRVEDLLKSTVENALEIHKNAYTVGTSINQGW